MLVCDLYFFVSLYLFRWYLMIAFSIRVDHATQRLHSRIFLKHNMKTMKFIFFFFEIRHIKTVLRFCFSCISVARAFPTEKNHKFWHFRGFCMKNGWNITEYRILSIEIWKTVKIWIRKMLSYTNLIDSTKYPHRMRKETEFNRLFSRVFCFVQLKSDYIHIAYRYWIKRNECTFSFNTSTNCKLK